MAIEFVCSSCGKTLRVPDEHLGKKARCPACQGINVIQAQDTAFESASPPEIPAEDISYNEYRPQTSSPIQPSLPPKHNPYASSAHQHATGFRKPHRGGLVLILGVLAFVCNFLLIPGILAWILGSSDLKQMRAGIMDRQGESLTQAGMILGIIATVLFLLGIATYILFIIVFVMIGVLG